MEKNVSYLISNTVLLPVLAIMSAVYMPVGCIYTTGFELTDIRLDDANTVSFLQYFFWKL